MKKALRNGFVALWLVIGSIAPAVAQVSVGVWMPGVSIGINLPAYPELVEVPGYPVYYAPRLNSNYFFYDGMYWVYQSDNWYASPWYNGPWGLIRPEAVPLFVLRVPVRYYRVPPPYFRGWHSDRPPRWDDHWGPEWKQRRSGWDHWDHRAVPPRAPLPAYQRQYSGSKYPPLEQQAILQRERYRYQPRDAEVQPHYQQHQAQAGSEKMQQRKPPAPGQQQAQPRAAQPPQQQPRQAPLPSERDRGSQAKGSQSSQDRELQEKGSGRAAGPGPKDGGKGDKGGGQKK